MMGTWDTWQPAQRQPYAVFKPVPVTMTAMHPNQLGTIMDDWHLSGIARRALATGATSVATAGLFPRVPGAGGGQSTTVFTSDTTFSGTSRFLRDDLVFYLDTPAGVYNNAEDEMPVVTNSFTGSSALVWDAYRFAGIMASTIAEGSNDTTITVNVCGSVPFVNNGDKQLRPGQLVAWAPPPAAPPRGNAAGSHGTLHGRDDRNVAIIVPMWASDVLCHGPYADLDVRASQTNAGGTTFFARDGLEAVDRWYDTVVDAAPAARNPLNTPDLRLTALRHAVREAEDAWSAAANRSTNATFRAMYPVVEDGSLSVVVEREYTVMSGGGAGAAAAAAAPTQDEIARLIARVVRDELMRLHARRTRSRCIGVVTTAVEQGARGQLQMYPLVPKRN